MEAYTSIMKLKEIALGTATIVTISLVGVSLASAQTNTDSSLLSPVPSTSSSQTYQSSDTRLQLRMLMQEHAVLAGDTLVARFDNKPDFQVAQSMLSQNTTELADVVGNLYGGDVRREFLSLWEQHNALYLVYTDALKSGDRNAQNKAKTDLDAFIMRISNLFSTRTQGANKDQLTNMFRDHVYFTRLVIENHAAKDFKTEYMNKHTGFMHAAAMGDILSGLPWNY